MTWTCQTPTANSRLPPQQVWWHPETCQLFHGFVLTTALESRNVFPRLDVNSSIPPLLLKGLDAPVWLLPFYR